MLNVRCEKRLVVLVPDAVDWVLGTWAREIAKSNSEDFDFAIFPFGEIARSPECFSRVLADSDVVHCMTQSAFSAVLEIVRADAPNQHLPVVASVHHIVDFEDVKPCLAADAIAVMCEEVRDALTAYGVIAEQIFLLRVGIDAEFFCPGDRAAARERLGISRDTFTIGFAAKATSDDRGRKGVDVLLAVIEKLSANGRAPLHVVLTGPGWERTIEEDMPPNVSVDYFSFLPRDRMADFYTALDVYVSTARIEGGPVPVLEAMSCATPVVSTRIGTVRDLVSDGEEALLVAPDDVEATVAAITSLRTDSERAERIAAAGRARILESLAGSNASRVARELYESCISESNRFQPRSITPEELKRLNQTLAAGDSQRWHANYGPKPDAGANQALGGLMRSLRSRLHRFARRAV